ncbi:ESPR-type extended signal peptide-containing protein [Dialister invisus]|uniref:ESPR-type extended signal peptide-containing protein n=3 Tax=Dialister invisus TaxID=218538 RepID=UPI00265AE236|nr:ESPR-type extended signal peptide-containing protein [Dialister invisus]
MNRVYKIVWSKAKNAYVVTSELAKNHTKNASGKMVKAALAAAMGMGVLMGGYMADAAPATNPSGDGPGIAIGTGSSSQKVDSTAVGKNAKTTGESALAVGCNNMAGADGAMAVGNDNKAMAGGSLAVGARNIAQGMGGLAIGESNTAKGDDSAAVGHSNKVHAMGTYAFGLQNTVWKMYSQAYGMNNIVSEINSFAYGNSNQVGSMNSFAFGGANLNTARWAVTVGNTNKVGGEHSFAAGFYNTIGSTSKDAVAIGQNARVGVSDFNVATTIDPTTGKITAVYNGEVDATNSVAIGHEANVMALNSVALGENTGVTKDGKNGTAIGGEASVKAENGTAAGFKATVRAKSGVALGASSFVDAEGGVALGRNSIAERKSGMAGYDFTTGAVSAVNDSTWKATDGAVSVGNSANTRQITRVAAGTEDTDAVNVAQIKGLAKKIVASTADYRLVQNASSADGSYTVDTNGDIDLTVEDKNHAGQKETVKLKDIASKSKLDDVINKGLQFDANVGGVQTNKLGSKITVKGEGTAADTDYSGENLKTFITQDPAGNTTIDVKMNKNLKAETVVATGENGKDGKIGINGKDGQTTNISVTRDGKPGVDGAPGTTTTRIVYEKPDGTKEEVATLNDGMKYGGDTGAVIKKKLNEQVNVVGGITDTNKLTTEDNLGVVSDGSNNLKVRLAKALKGLESVTTGDTVMNNSGVTINNGAAGNPVSLTKNGLDNGGNKITNVAAGVNGTDAVNVNQLNTVAGEAAKHTTVKAKDSNVTVTEGTNGTGGKEYTVGLGDKVTLGTDPSKQVSIDGTTGIIKAGDKVTINGTTGNIDAGKVKINGKDGTVNGLTNKTWDPNNFTSGQAATEDQLKEVDNKINNVSTDLTNKGMDFAGNEGEFHRNLGEKVTIKGEGTKAASEYSGENIRTFADTNGNVVVKMDKNLKTETIVATGENGKDGKIGINGKDGQTTNISVTRDGKPGVDGAPGTTTTRIVYEKPDGTKEEVATLNDGMKYGGDTGNVIKKKLNEQVNVVGGITDTNKLTTEDNLGVVSDGNNNLKVRMAKDLKGLNSVTTNTLTVGDVKIDNSGINAGNKKITNVAAGDISANSTDAVNGGQLWKTNQTINNIGGAVNELGTRVNRVGAGAAALAALHPLDFDPDDKWDVAAGYGNYKDAHAVSVGAFYRPNEDTMFSVGGSFGGGENMVNAGVSVKLGQGNHVSTSKVAMAKEIVDLKDAVTRLEAQNEQFRQIIGQMAGQPVRNVEFPDVPKDHWAYSYVKSLADRGLLEGYPDGEFKGDRSMTRYEFAAIIYRALQNGAPVDGNMGKAMEEFGPEMEKVREAYRFRVDRISGEDNDRNKVERVRVNNEGNKEKGDYRDIYGSHIAAGK